MPKKKEIKDFAKILKLVDTTSWTRMFFLLHLEVVIQILVTQKSKPQTTTVKTAVQWLWLFIYLHYSWKQQKPDN